MEEKENSYLEKQIMIVIGIALVFILIGVVFLVRDIESNHFESIGLVWEKQLHGETIFYLTNIQGYSFEGYPINFNFNMRNDPRKLKRIPVQGEVELVKNRVVYVSIDPESEIEKCNQESGGKGNVAMINLGRFSAEMRMNFEIATTSEENSQENNIHFITCENTPNNSVFIITTGEESRIVQKTNNCYELIVNDCEIIEVVERLQIEILSKLTGKRL